MAARSGHGTVSLFCLLLLIVTVFAMPSSVNDSAKTKPVNIRKASCPNLWVYWNGSDLHCYYFDTTFQSLTWYEAEQECVQQGIDDGLSGSHLVSIHSAAEDDFINTYFGWTSALVYVGLQQSAVGSPDYRWTDGTSLVYTNWDVNEPDSGDSTLQCSFFSRDSDKWYDQSCTTRANFNYACKAFADGTTGATPTVTAAPMQTTSSSIASSTAPPTPTSRAAFSAARTSSQVITDNRVYLDHVLLNDGGNFDNATSTFIAPYPGFYWLSMSVGVDDNTEADAYMTGSERMSNIVRGLAVAGYDVVSRDEVFAMNGVCNQVKMWSSATVYSDNYLQTSLSGFWLDTVLDTAPVVFSIALSNQVTCPTGSRVPFNAVMLDEGNGWSSSIYEYIAPKSGTYVLSLSVGSQPSYRLGVGLYNYGSLITGIQMGSTDHNYESLGKTVVADVDAGEHLYAACGYLYNPSYIFSDVLTQTKLTGFLYRPRDFQPVAWSVANSELVQGYVDYVSFPVIVSNVGGGWNTDRFVVPTSGVYYINLATGVNTGSMTRMDLLINNTVLVNVYRSSTDHNGVRTRSRSIVYRLNAGDVLHIRIPAGYQLYSSDNRLTTFTGFLLYY